MATNFFWIGYHFEEFRSQVDIWKKDSFHALYCLITFSGLLFWLYAYFMLQPKLYTVIYDL